MNRKPVVILTVVALLGIVSFWLYDRSSRTGRAEPKQPNKPSGGRDTKKSDQTSQPVSDTSAGTVPVPSNAGDRDTKRTGTLIVRITSSDASQRHDLKVMVVDDRTGKIDARGELRGDRLTAEFRDVPVGTKVVVVLPQSGNLAPAHASTSVLEGSTAELTVTVLAGLSVTGVVVDEMGNPVANAEVAASLYLGYSLPGDRQRPFYFVSSTSSDGTGWSFFSTGHVYCRIQSAQDGSFSFPNVGWGPVELTANKGGLKCAGQWVNPGDRVRLVISRQ